MHLYSTVFEQSYRILPINDIRQIHISYMTLYDKTNICRRVTEWNLKMIFLQFSLSVEILFHIKDISLRYFGTHGYTSCCICTIFSNAYSTIKFTVSSHEKSFKTNTLFLPYCFKPLMHVNLQNGNIWIRWWDLCDFLC